MLWEGNHVEPKVSALLLQDQETKGISNSQKSNGKKDVNDNMAHAHKRRTVWGFITHGPLDKKGKGTPCSELGFEPLLLIGGPLTTYQIVLRAPRNVCG